MIQPTPMWGRDEIAKLVNIVIVISLNNAKVSHVVLCHLGTMSKERDTGYPLVICYIAIENGAFSSLTCLLVRLDGDFP